MTLNCPQFRRILQSSHLGAETAQRPSSELLLVSVKVPPPHTHTLTRLSKLQQLPLFSTLLRPLLPPGCLPSELTSPTYPNRWQRFGPETCVTFVSKMRIKSQVTLASQPMDIFSLVHTHCRPKWFLQILNIQAIWNMTPTK